MQKIKLQMDENVDSKNDILKDENFMTSIDSILNIDGIFDELYFYHFTEEVEYLSEKLKTSKTDIKNIFKTYLSGLLYTLDKASRREEMIISTDLLDLILYPILNNFRLNKKTYKDFNIRIDYFIDLKNYNIDSKHEDEYENILDIKSFTFKGTKLESFVLYRSTYNIHYEYDKDYNLKNIVFANGEDFKIS